MKPITWLRKLARRSDQGYPVATLAFYGPDDKKASKAVLGIILSKDSEVQLHKWFRESPDADLRYDIKLQNAWIEIIRREGLRSVAMIEEINGCPHEEGQDYPLGEVCPACPFGRTGDVHLSRQPPFLLQLPPTDKINGKRYSPPLRTGTQWTKLGKNGMRALKN